MSLWERVIASYVQFGIRQNNSMVFVALAILKSFIASFVCSEEKVNE